MSKMKELLIIRTEEVIEELREEEGCSLDWDEAMLIAAASLQAEVAEVYDNEVNPKRIYH